MLVLQLLSVCVGGHMSLIVELSQQLSTSESELKRAQLALKELGVES